MRKIFIADAHLNRAEDENYRLLLDFLGTLKGNTDTLFILGDLFEFWIGYRNIAFPHYLPILNRLRDLRESGVNIVYFEGNHDFHMGPFFAEILQASIFKGPAVIDIEGKRVYLCHGDQINAGDYGYRLLRCMLHSRFTDMLTLVVPPAVASYIAARMGTRSRKSHGKRGIKWDYMQIARDFASRQFAAGCDVIVTGHFHVPLLERTVTIPERVFLSLGDWITQFSYGEWLNGDITLKEYR